MPLLRHHVRIHVIEATPAQVAKGISETTDLFRRARDICRELELPATEVRHVAAHLDSQVAMLVDADMEAKHVARSKAISALIQKEQPAAPMFGGVPPYPNLGHFQHGSPLGQPSIERGPWTPVGNVEPMNPPWTPVGNMEPMNPHDALALQQMYSPGGILHRSPTEERRMQYLELDDDQLNEKLRAAGLPTI